MSGPRLRPALAPSTPQRQIVRDLLHAQRFAEQARDATPPSRLSTARTARRARQYYLVQDHHRTDGSSRAVGWCVADADRATLFRPLFEDAIAKDSRAPGRLTLHAERGDLMKVKPACILTSPRWS